ncbi:transcription factor HB29-like protein [Trifolium pratense]|uniref:Transcription factor HB29-like protein n=2 Tax=Trifolium pratense TaxID=57577 RepID=A0A2K3LNE1_TRIPR|nr:transcription factor HB29-like protein [Trifolium pratense]CAJ2665669.1 unnamed protein product [Trifolium pratense]
MMEVLTTTTTTNTITTPLTNSKPQEPESENPTRIQQPITLNITKPLSFSNGVLKRHHPNTHNHHNNHHHNNNNNNNNVVVTYKECLKNHVATLGGHALDGCCEFMPSPTATSDDPASIKCAACGCHRNFHRREPEEPISTVFEYQPHHRHHPPPPPLFQSRSPSSPSPPPISSYPSAPHMLLALSGAGVGLSIPPENTAAPLNLSSPMGTSRKRFRTKFTQEQKEKMHEFAEKVGWKMQKRDEEMVNGFCNEVGVDRSVLKVWMHNNKNTLGRKLTDHVNGNGAAAVGTAVDGGSGGGFSVHENENNGTNVAACGTTNGSSSSS